MQLNLYLKLTISTVIGALIGYAYYYFIGCTTGSCPLTSNWHYTTLYGAAFGFAFGLPSKKKGNKNGN